MEHDAERPGAQVDASGAIGVQVGDHGTQNITVQMAPPPVAARSAYLSVVGQIAPPALLDRASELAELTAFCTRPDSGSYLWWRAEAWAGKTALMSWFTLNPPSGTRIVSFFVTGRLSGHDTREGFLREVMQQLAQLLGEPIPAPDYEGEETRVARLWRMFEDAAALCRTEGRRLVLVVDGLDEDRMAGGHGIAAVLPPQPKNGMRVIVSGRPDPPLDRDVLDVRHPLRDPGIVRTMAPSPHAGHIRQAAEGELSRLLAGTPQEQELLGLLTAAGGGLTSQDLAELTGRPQERVESCLNAVAGRTFSRRPSLGWAEPDAAAEVYLLGHEELQRAAVDELGEDSLAEYRRALHSWAQLHRREGWPERTPEYLLRGYFRMLQAVGDVDRMVECGLDRRRHERMRAMSGADASALAEIDTTRQTLADRAEQRLAEPDLRSMALLAVHRELLALRSDRIPVGLPAVWGAAGRPARAENLVRSMAGHRRDVRAMCELVAALAERGDHDQAEILADGLTVRIATVLRQAPGIDRELSGVAGVLTGSGYDGQAETVARTIPTEHFSLRALGSVLRELALRGEQARAGELADEIVARITRPGPPGDTPDAETLQGSLHFVRSLFETREAHRTTSILVSTLAYVGFPGHAEAVVESVTDESLRSQLMTQLHAGTAGDIRETESYYEPADSAFGIPQEDRVPMALTRVARKVAGRGDFDRAWEIACGITHTAWLARAQTDVARAAARAGLTERACAFARTAESVVYGISNASTVMFMLSSAADAFTSSGRLDHAQAVARRVEEITWDSVDEDGRESIQRNRARTLAAARMIGHAEQVARGLGKESGLALTSVVRALADLGQIDDALDVVESMSGSYGHSTLSHVAQAAARLGDPDLAEAIAEEITDSTELAKVMADIGRAWAEAGDMDQAVTRIAEAESQARVFSDQYMASRPWVNIVKAWRAARMHGRARDAADEAERRARRLTDPETLPSRLADVAQALAAAGRVDRAEKLAHSILAVSGRPHYQAQALVNLVPHVPPDHGRRLVAQALRAERWQTSADALAVLAPDALLAVVDECFELLRR